MFGWCRLPFHCLASDWHWMFVTWSWMIMARHSIPLSKKQSNTYRPRRLCKALDAVVIFRWLISYCGSFAASAWLASGTTSSHFAGRKCHLELGKPKISSSKDSCVLSKALFRRFMVLNVGFLAGLWRFMRVLPWHIGGASKRRIAIWGSDLCELVSVGCSEL